MVFHVLARSMAESFLQAVKHDQHQQPEHGTDQSNRDLAEACGGPVTVASDGAAGAAWLASLELLGSAALALRPQLLGP